MHAARKLGRISVSMLTAKSRPVYMPLVLEKTGRNLVPGRINLRARDVLFSLQEKLGVQRDFLAKLL